MYCHGNYDGAKCSKCGQDADPSKVMQALKLGEPQKCEIKSDCDGWVKPTITFFGEVKPYWAQILEILKTFRDYLKDLQI